MFDKSLSVDYSKLNNKYVMPHDITHRTLKAINEGIYSETDVCKETFRAQGYYGAAVFVIPLKYGLCGAEKWWGRCDFWEGMVARYLDEGLSEKGQKVLEFLNAGKVVNLKDLKINIKKTKEAANKTAADYLKINPFDSSAITLYWLRDNPGSQTRTDILKYGGMHCADATRYLKKLEGAGLVILNKNGVGVIGGEITKAGIDFANTLEEKKAEVEIKHLIKKYDRDRRYLLNLIKCGTLFKYNLVLRDFSDYLNSYEEVLLKTPETITKKKAKDHQAITRFIKESLPDSDEILNFVLSNNLDETEMYHINTLSRLGYIKI